MTCPHCSVVYLAPTRACRVCGGPLTAYTGPAAGDGPKPVRTVGAVAAALLAGNAIAQLVLMLLRATGGSSTSGAALTIPAVAVTAPVFLLWFFRVRHNAGLWGPQRHGRAWAVWGWFVPVVSLWFPYQIAADVSTPEQVGATESRTTQGLVRLWWAAWVLAVLSDTYGWSHHHWRAFTPGSTIAGSAFAAASALLGMRVVRRLTAVQDARISQSPVFLAPLRLVTLTEEPQSSDATRPSEPRD